jgi:hypothetical protein
MLAFTSVYFLESGLFNGLRPFGVKNFSPIARHPFWLQTATQRRFVDVSRQSRGFAELELIIPTMIAVVSALSKKMSMASEIRLATLGDRGESVDLSAAATYRGHLSVFRHGRVKLGHDAGVPCASESLDRLRTPANATRAKSRVTAWFKYWDADHPARRGVPAWRQGAGWSPRPAIWRQAGFRSAAPRS